MSEELSIPALYAATITALPTLHIISMVGAFTQFIRSPTKLKELLREPRLVCGPIHPIMVLATGTVHTRQINVSLRGASIEISIVFCYHW